jgi:hypothetical protein
MCINCNLRLPVRPDVATRLGLGSDDVLMSHRELLEALTARCADAPLAASFPEIGQGTAPHVHLDVLQELDLEPLFANDGLAAINFANSSEFVWTVREERQGHALGNVVRMANPPAPRPLPPGYPLKQLCYQSCAAMMRAMARPGGVETMQEVFAGRKPAWRVAEDEATRLRDPQVPQDPHEPQDPQEDEAAGRRGSMCRVM